MNFPTMNPAKFGSIRPPGGFKGPNTANMNQLKSKDAGSLIDTLSQTAQLKSAQSTTQGVFTLGSNAKQYNVNVVASGNFRATSADGKIEIRLMNNDRSMGMLTFLYTNSDKPEQSGYSTDASVTAKAKALGNKFFQKLGDNGDSGLDI